MAIKKVISGMQSGADIAGIKAAIACNIEEVGGYMPKGFKTEKGNKPVYKELYNAVETASSDYILRTRKNVQTSDATIIFDYVRSSGSVNTKKFCVEYNKPHLYLTSKEIQNFDLACETIIRFISDNEIKILNIAGNRESKAPEIEKKVYNILVEVFKTLT